MKFIQILLHQLLFSSSSIPPEAITLFETVRKRKQLLGWAELKTLFLDICSKSSDVPIVLVALDECAEEANREPVREFIDSVKDSRGRLVVTSRIYPADIDQLLRDCKQILIEASESAHRARAGDHA